MRLDHGPQRQLLQVPQLRLDERLQLSGSFAPPPRAGRAPRPFNSGRWPDHSRAAKISNLPSPAPRSTGSHRASAIAPSASASLRGVKRAGGRPRRHGLDLDAAAMRRAVAGLVLLVVAACSAAAPSISESMAPADDASADAQAMSSPAEPSESSSVVITDGSPSLAAVASFQSSPTPAKAATPKPATPKPATPKPATPKPKPTPTASPWLGYCGDVRSPVQAAAGACRHLVPARWRRVQAHRQVPGRRTQVVREPQDQLVAEVVLELDGPVVDPSWQARRTLRRCERSS